MKELKTKDYEKVDITLGVLANNILGDKVWLDQKETNRFHKARNQFVKYLERSL